MQTLEYVIPGMHCGNCERAVEAGLRAVTGVATVDVDLERKLVSVGGEQLDDAALRDAIEEAGYSAV